MGHAEKATRDCFRRDATSVSYSRSKTGQTRASVAVGSAANPTVGNSKKSHMLRPGRIKPIRTRPTSNTTEDWGQSRARTYGHFASENPPQGQVQKAVPSLLSQGAASPLPTWIRSKNCRVQQQDEEEQEREKKMRSIREEEEDETRLRGDRGERGPARKKELKRRGGRKGKKGRV